MRNVKQLPNRQIEVNGRIFEGIMTLEDNLTCFETIVKEQNYKGSFLDFCTERMQEVKKQVPPVKKGDNITIIGRRWFDRINGNTYFSAVGLVNGIQVVEIPYEYGYGNHYEDRIYQELEKAGYCPDVEHYKNGGREAFWQYCNRKGITKYVTHSDVNRKKDL